MLDEESTASRQDGNDEKVAESMMNELEALFASSAEQGTRFVVKYRSSIIF